MWLKSTATAPLRSRHRPFCPRIVPVRLSVDVPGASAAGGAVVLPGVTAALLAVVLPAGALVAFVGVRDACAAGPVAAVVEVARRLADLLSEGDAPAAVGEAAVNGGTSPESAGIGASGSAAETDGRPPGRSAARP